MPGIQPTVEIAVRRWVMPRSGSRSQAASTLSRFIIGSPMPMNTQWSIGLDAAEVQRLVEDLRARSGCARTSSRRSRRTCRSAGSRTARRRRSSGGRRGSASARPRPARPSAVREQRLDRAVARVRLVLERQASRTAARAASALAQRGRQVGHLLVAARAARRPRPHLARAEGAARRASASVVSSSRGPCSRSSGCTVYRWQPPAAMRLAKYLAHAGVASRRAAEALIAAGRVTRRRRDRHRPGARRRRATSASPSTAARRGRRAARRLRAATSRAGVVSTARDTARAARPSSSSSRRAGCACTRSGASTPTPPA